MKAVIFDMDGTLADCNHRKVHLPNWGKFFADMHLDTQNPPVVWLAKQLDIAARIGANSGESFAIIIVTARPDDLNYHEMTRDWLRLNGINYDRMYMRKGGDYRPDYLIKREILQQMIDDGYEPILAVDDRPAVVKMWREFGLPCLQCADDEDFNGRPKPYEGECKLHMMVGPSGAGKSSYAADNYKPQDIVSTDAIRVMLFGDQTLGHTPEGLAQTWGYAHDWIHARLKNGIFTVLDATNLKRKDRLKVLEAVPKGQYVTYVVIDRDLMDKTRDRGWRPEELILKHHKTFGSQIKDILKADEQGNVVVIDKRYMK